MMKTVYYFTAPVYIFDDKDKNKLIRAYYDLLKFKCNKKHRGKYDKKFYKTKLAEMLEVIWGMYLEEKNVLQIDKGDEWIFERLGTEEMYHLYQELIKNKRIEEKQSKVFDAGYRRVGNTMYSNAIDFFPKGFTGFQF